jgi:uncharacterized membrane protein
MFRHFRTKIRAYFITGLLTVLPIIVTILVLSFFINFLDHLFGAPFKDFIERYRFPGIGLVVFIVEFAVAILLIILIGLFVTNFVGKAILGWSEAILSKVPIISKVYSAIKQLIQTLFIKRGESFTSVVLVEYPRKGIHSIGFVTTKTKGELNKIGKEELINVFIPTTPNPTSGYLLIVPQKDVIPLNMSIEDGLKLIISGGIVSPEEKNDPNS